MAKIKGKRGFRFIKELGGAIRRETVSKTARFLDEHQLLRGRVLDYGCGFGFDADHFGWEAYDPHYQQKLPEGTFDTVVCNHVANMLTRQSRLALYRTLGGLLAPGGAKVWDAATGKDLLTLRGAGAPLNCFAFSPDGKRLVSAGDDGTAGVWDVTPPEQWWGPEPTGAGSGR